MTGAYISGMTERRELIARFRRRKRDETFASREPFCSSSLFRSTTSQSLPGTESFKKETLSARVFLTYYNVLFLLEEL